MDSLPTEISRDILSRLPISSLVQSRLVSRTWRKLVHEVSLLNLHLSRMAKNKNPSIILHCLDPIPNQLHFVELSDLPRENEIVCKIDIPFRISMPDKFHVLGSCNGLLCISNEYDNDPYYIYNPFTRKYKELPRSRQFEGQRVEAGFGFDPVANEYKVVRMVYYTDPYTGPLPRQYRCGYPSYPHSEVQICSVGVNTWRSIGPIPWHFKREAMEHNESSNDHLLLNGRLHWLIVSGRYNLDNNRATIVSFDLSDEQFHGVQGPTCGSLNKPNYLLLVLGGCLSAAVYSSDGKVEIWRMKEYNVRESWIKEFDIDAHPRNIDPGVQKSSNFRCFFVHGIWKNRVLHGKAVRVLSILKNGDVLLEYKDGKLASYDLGNREITDLLIQGMPTRFHAVEHFGSLNWVDETPTANTCMEDIKT